MGERFAAKRAERVCVRGVAKVCAYKRVQDAWYAERRAWTRGVRVCRSQLEVVPRNSTGGGRPMSTVSAGGSLGRGSRALHLQHHQSSLSALHMTANHSGTVDRRRSSLRVTYRIDSKTPGPFTTAPGTRWYFYYRLFFSPCILPRADAGHDSFSLQIANCKTRFFIFSYLFNQFLFLFICCCFLTITVRKITDTLRKRRIEWFNRNKFLWFFLSFLLFNSLIYILNIDSLYTVSKKTRDIFCFRSIRNYIILE